MRFVVCGEALIDLMPEVQLSPQESRWIARSGGGINESFTVRKISFGVGVERRFPLHSPSIDSIKLVRKGRVRRAKLYYLRKLRGKAARIVERRDNSAKATQA